MKNIGVILFNNFETLDVFGPVEIFGRLTDDYSIKFYSQHGGLINNAHGVSLATENIVLKDNIVEQAVFPEIIIIPGGYGTRVEVNNDEFLDQIIELCNHANYVLTVCTGSGLLAKTGILDGKKATSNKKAFDWAMAQSEKVLWQKKARWVVDGKFYTSAGVSAGMDMALGFLADFHGVEFARKITYEIEYTWQENKDLDEFYLQNFSKK